MFKKKRTLIAFTIAILLVFFLHLKGFFFISEKRVEEYVNLILRTQGKEDEVVNQTPTMRQKREGVSKTLLLSDSSGRRAVRLRSSTSELVATNLAGNYEVLEKFKEVCCDSQEGSYYRLPNGEESQEQLEGALLMQRVRHIDAEEASYDYNKDLLAAEKVNIIRFSAEGDSLKENWGEVKPMMEGEAETLFFTLVEHEPNFKASRVKLKITGQETIPR